MHSVSQIELTPIDNDGNREPHFMNKIQAFSNITYIPRYDLKMTPVIYKFSFYYENIDSIYIKT